MVHIPKVVGVLSFGFLLGLSLSYAAQADNAASPANEMKPDQAQMKADQTDRRQGGQEAGEKQMNDEITIKGGPSKSGKTITGEMLRVEGDNYFVKEQEGKEVRMHTDKTTLIMGNLRQGDQIEANVNDQDHAFLIRPIQERIH